MCSCLLRIYLRVRRNRVVLELIRFFSIKIRRYFFDKYILKENYVLRHTVDWTRNHLKYQILLETIADLDLDRQIPIVDIGCNQGNLSILLAIQGYKVIGIDINPDAIKYAEEIARKQGQPVVFINCSIDKIPLSENSIQFAFMFDVLEHIYKEDLENSMRRIRSILQHGGKLLILVPFGHSYDDGRSHVSFFTLQTLKNLVEANGFNVDYIGVDRRGDLHTESHNLIKLLLTRSF